MKSTEIPTSGTKLEVQLKTGVGFLLLIIEGNAKFLLIITTKTKFFQFKFSAG